MNKDFQYYLEQASNARPYNYGFKLNIPKGSIGDNVLSLPEDWFLDNKEKEYNGPAEATIKGWHFKVKIHSDYYSWCDENWSAKKGDKEVRAILESDHIKIVATNQKVYDEFIKDMGVKTITDILREFDPGDI